MANLITRSGNRRHLSLVVLSALLLSAVGCGFPHDRYMSDPLLGQFNRPIAMTPPIWTGGDPGVSPAWDAGSRMGLPSPDVPAASNANLKRMFIMPTFSGSLGLGSFLRGDMASANTTNSLSSSAPAPRRPMTVAAAGASFLPSTPVQTMPAVAAAPMTPASVMPRPLDSHTLLTSGSAFEANVPSPKVVQAVFVKDPRAVATVEEGQSILQTCGARSMAMEPQPTGDWRFICTIGDGPDQRRYEALHGDQIEAVRAVMWQVKNER